MPINRISKRGDGRWTYGVTDINGKRRQINSRSNETKTAFSRRCDQLDILARKETSEETLTELFSHWIASYVSLQRSKSYKQSNEHHYYKHVAPVIGHKKLNEITRAEVYKLIAHAQTTGLSKSSLQKIRTCISAPYNWAINSLGYPLTSPTQGLIIRYDEPDTNHTNKAIAEDDLQRILTAAKHSKYEQYYRILLATGLRPSEALGLQIQDIQEDHLRIRRAVTIHGLGPLKTKSSERNIPMHVALQKALYTQRDRVAFQTKEGWLFPSGASGIPSMNAVKSAFRRVLEQTATYKTGGRNGMKKLAQITPPVQANLYDFRHTFATRCAEQNMNPTVLRNILGHADITTTLNYYVELTPEMIERAVVLLEANSF